MNKLLERFDNKQEAIQILSDTINVSKGAVKRWISADKVPDAYRFDLMKIIGEDIDYSKYNFSEKDQFYTPKETALKCYDIFRDLLEQYGEDECEYSYIEPSAGDGSFLNVLPTTRTIGFDIEPRHPDIKRQDYLEWLPDNTRGKVVVFGNPPFGLRGNLALRFINHSYQFADYVCFILPQLFASDGKGVPKRRVKGYNLVYSEKINPIFYAPGKEHNEITVNTVFQIWSKYHTNEKYSHTTNTTNNNIVRIYSLSDGNTPSSTRNKKMLNACDVYIPSTCFGKDNMRFYENFEDLPSRRGYGLAFKTDRLYYIEKCKEIDWSEIGFQSTNSAWNIRSSQIMEALDF